MKIILMMALSADGKIGKHSYHLANWTSREDKQLFVETSKKAGVVVMGENTFKTIGKPLPYRLNVVLTRDIKLKANNLPDLLEFTTDSPKELLENLKNRGYETVILGGGAAINSLFLKEKLVDELVLTIEPKLFGDGLGLFSNLDVDLNLKLLEFKKLSPDVVNLKYKIIWPS
jgi:dihydrofolate reductase